MVAPNFRYRRLAFAVVYRTVLFPFDSVQFLRSLAKNGWVLSEQLENMPIGLGRFDVGGKIAGKGDVSIRLDSDKKVLAVDAAEPRVTVDELGGLERILKNELDIDSPSLAYFYEFTANVNLKGKKNPLDVWSARSPGFPLVQEFSRIIGQRSMLFGMRLAQFGESPNRPDWFEIRLEPSIQTPTAQHWMEVVFRRADRAQVVGFAENFEDRAAEMISLIEGDAP